MGRTLLICLLLCGCQPASRSLSSSASFGEVLQQARQQAASLSPSVHGLQATVFANGQQGYLAEDGRYLILCPKSCQLQKAGTDPLAGQRVMHEVASPLSGLDELQLSAGQIVYADAQHQTIYWGHLIDLRDGSDLTQAHEAWLAQGRWQHLPLSAARVDTQGNGRRQLALLTGGRPSAALQQALKRLPDRTLYLLPDSGGLDPALLPALLTPQGQILSLAGMPADQLAFLPGLVGSWLEQGRNPGWQG